MIRNNRARNVLLTLAACLVCAPLPAASYLPMSDVDLVRLAPIAARAEVADRTIRLDRDGDRDLPFTVVTLRTIERYKGTLEDIFQVVIPGGISGDITWWVPGAPTFEEGQEVVLMLNPLPGRSGEYGLSEFGLSKFDLVSDATGRRFLVRPVFGAREDLVVSKHEFPLVPASVDAAAAPARDAESFFSALRQISGGAPLSPLTYVTPSGSLEPVHSAAREPARSGLRPQWANLGGVELGNCGGVPCLFRWFFDTGGSSPATVFVTGTQSNLVDTYPACGTNQTCLVQTALNNWHNIASTDIRISGPMPTGNFEIKLDMDVAHNGVSWTTPYDCSNGGVVGIGGPTSQGTAKTFKGLSPYYACGTATVSMRRWTCPYQSAVFLDVLTHEMGHGLGLNHPDQFRSVFSTSTTAQENAAIMFSSSHAPARTAPQADDIQAMQFYYGTAPLGAAPVASFTFAGAGTSVAFTDTTTNSPTGWLWFFGEPSSPSNFLRDRNPTHVYAGAGTYTVDLIAGNFNGGSRATKQVTVTGGGGGGPLTGFLTLASVASVHGANQTFFHSDVWILNRSFTKAIDITLRYRCLTGLSCAAAPQVINLPPRGSRLFSDLVVSTFASPETVGALEIGWDASLGKLAASSRLYTPSLPSPTSGFSLPALAPAEARTRAVFVGLAGSGGDLSQGFRTNAGAYNPNASPVTVTFTLHAASGAVLGSPYSRTYGAYEPIQLNNIFSVVGSGTTVATDAYLVVSTNGLPVFPYVAVIDNKSGDSVWVIPSDDEAS